MSMIDRIIAEFVSGNGHLSTPAGARGACYAASAAFVHFAADHGVPAEVVAVGGHPVAHFAVRAAGEVIDFTARQFDTGADFPDRSVASGAGDTRPTAAA